VYPCLHDQEGKPAATGRQQALYLGRVCHAGGSAGPAEEPGTDADVEPTSIGSFGAESYRILRSRIDLAHLAPLTRAVTERVILASADFSYAADLACDERALGEAVVALASGAPVVADVAMVAAGIGSRKAICRAGDTLTARLARVTGITPAEAAVRLAFSEAGPGAVWVVGEASGAIPEAIGRGTAPALVIAMPAGLVGAAEAKKLLRASGLPALTNVSEKGGCAVAAAAACALLDSADRLAEFTGDRRETR
jgi:precorrin-8X/cobalt-precorrin-8 methylmutase